MKPNVTIIILNWNGWKDTIECLESLYQINYPNYDVIVVDNHSEDDSIEKIKEYCDGSIQIESNFFEYNSENKPLKIFEINEDKSENLDLNNINRKTEKNIILIKNDENQGFSEGNNIGIRFALEKLNPEYVLLLNNDTVVDKYFLDEMVEIAENKNLSIVGPTIYFYKDPTKIQSAGVHFSWKTGKNKLLRANEIDNHELKDILPVDYVSGCCLLSKRNVFVKCGLLDPEYFAYWEEVDFCTRAKKEGFNVFYVPKSKVWHKVSNSSQRIKGLNTYYLSRNMFLFMKKNLSKIKISLFLIYFIGFKFWFMSSILIYNKDLVGFKSFLRGIKDGVFKS